MNLTKIYLAGNIEGLSYKTVTEWRREAAFELSKYSIDVFDPMRGKEFLEGLDVINTRKYCNHLPATFILERDKQDIYESHALLVNFEYFHKMPSIGTTMELGMAMMSNFKPIYGFNCYKLDHPFLINVRQHVTLKDALKHIISDFA